MPVRHTVVCNTGHKYELITEHGKNVIDYVCSECGESLEILWEAKKNEYQVRLGLVNRM